MAVVGYVTKIAGSPLASANAVGATGRTGGSAFVARSAVGITLGTYKSVGEAQAAVQQQAAGARILRWSRSDLAGQIESYQGED